MAFRLLPGVYLQVSQRSGLLNRKKVSLSFERRIEWKMTGYTDELKELMFQLTGEITRPRKKIYISGELTKSIIELDKYVL